jgi:hypothetical protein
MLNLGSSARSSPRKWDQVWDWLCSSYENIKQSLAKMAMVGYRNKLTRRSGVADATPAYNLAFWPFKNYMELCLFVITTRNRRVLVCGA